MNMHKISTIALIAAVGFGFVAAGFWTDEDSANTDKEDQITENVDTTGITPGTSFWAESKATEANQQDLTSAEPIPNMDDSLERQNLRERYETLNDQNEIFHVYLMSHGKVVSYFTAQGKVSSVNSKLTQTEQVFRVPGCNEHRSGNDCWKTVSSPQLDGSYGTNGDAVFFFTTDGSYVEWNGEYVVSQRPLSINTPISLEADVNASVN